MTGDDMNDRGLLLVSAIAMLMLAITAVVVAVAIDAGSGIVAGITYTGGT
jgi:hypothetical protein